MALIRSRSSVQIRSRPPGDNMKRKYRSICPICGKRLITPSWWKSTIAGWGYDAGLVSYALISIGVEGEDE